MSIESPAPGAKVLPLKQLASVPPDNCRTARSSGPFAKAAVFFWKFFFGLILTQAVLGSVLVAGWAYRLMQRAVLKQWWRTSRRVNLHQNFEEFLEASHRTAHHVTWPNWIAGQNAWRKIREAAGAGAAAQLRTAFRMALPSLWANAKLGTQAILNTWMLTMPGCLLWLFAWYDGWNNSFNKGYEQALVGPLTGLLGVALFMAAMLYVPMAQARQASTGNWRSFYQFRLVWGLVRRTWLGCLALAFAYSAISIPVTVLRTMPTFFSNINPALEDAEPAQVVQLLNTYFFWASVVLFPAFIAVRLLAARLYARALLDATQSGALNEEALSDGEWEALHSLDLLQIKPIPRSHTLVRAVSWLGTRTGRIAATVLMLFIWFTFVAQIFVSEFFNYHPVIGWLNQPLVQLPILKYIPAGF